MINLKHSTLSLIYIENNIYTNSAVSMCLDLYNTGENFDGKS